MGGNASVNELLPAKKCQKDIGETVKHEERICNEAETARELTYLGDRVSAGEGF